LTVLQLLGLVRNCDGKEYPDSFGVGVYDGDMPSGKRDTIRKQASFVLSNPDMLHLGILPHHTQWADFFTNIKFIVIDEVHIYRGIFGSHFANVLRRLKRILSFYGADPTYIAASATLSNSRSFVEQLTEKSFQLIDNDTAPNGRKHFFIYNPPIVNRELGIRKPAVEESQRIAEQLFTSDCGQTLLFAHTRKTVEILLSRLEQSTGSNGRIVGYRSGYLPGERRQIETGFRNGSINMVVATNALELGIDIGGIDTVLINGYPGSITSTKQQAGRAGRQGAESCTVLVASASLIDQYLVNNPDYLFKKNPEAALINPDNPYILFHHLQCAAF